MEATVYKGDMKDCLSRCIETDHIFKNSEPCMAAQFTV